MLERLIGCQIKPPNTRSSKKLATGNVVAIKLSQYHILRSAFEVGQKAKRRVHQ